MTVLLGTLLGSFLCSDVIAQATDALVTTEAAVSQARMLSQVTEIFQNRCSECHGPENARPKGDFGYVMDLARMAQTPSLVVPGKPDDSELFLMIDLDDMPPAKSKFGPMPDDEKKIVSDWIANGAFAIAAKPSSNMTGMAESSEQSNADVEPEKTKAPLYYLIGRLHPIAVHFPIALIMAAGLAELFSLTQRRTGMTSAVTFCLLLGSAGAVIAAITGWIFAIEQGYAIELTTQTPSLHRWLGVGCALASPALLWVDLLSNKDRRLFRVCLLLVIGLVGAVGHFGGLMVYGESFFSL